MQETKPEIVVIHHCPRCEARLYQNPFEGYWTCRMCGFMREDGEGRQDEEVLPISLPAFDEPIPIHAPRRRDYPQGYQGLESWKTEYARYYYQSKTKAKRSRGKYA